MEKPLLLYVCQVAWLQAGEVLFQHLINCAVSSQAIVMISYVRKAAWLQAEEVLFRTVLYLLYQNHL